MNPGSPRSATPGTDPVASPNAGGADDLVTPTEASSDDRRAPVAGADNAQEAVLPDLSQYSEPNEPAAPPQLESTDPLVKRLGVRRTNVCAERGRNALGSVPARRKGNGKIG